LRKAAALRNVICHEFWDAPDSDGFSVPFFVNKKEMKFETAINIEYLQQAQAHVAELACKVISTVTLMGYQFPGSNSGGKPVY
jgi:hypothetical protein